MTKPKKRKLLAILCRSDILDRMDLSDTWTTEPETFTPQMTALWDAMDKLDVLDDDETESVSSIDSPTSDVLTAMAAI